MVERIQSPWTQPFGRRDLNEDPPRLDGLPFAFPVVVAFFPRSKAAVFSFTMTAGETREGKLCGGESERAGRGRREQRERENAEALFKKPSPGAFIRSLPSG